jgi:hypothetical protein
LQALDDAEIGAMIVSLTGGRHWSAAVLERFLDARYARPFLRPPEKLAAEVAQMVASHPEARYGAGVHIDFDTFYVWWTIRIDGRQKLLRDSFNFLFAGFRSPGRYRHSDTTLCISLVIIHTKHTGRRDK